MLYNLGPGREPAQIQQMIELETRGVCVFCPDHFAKEHREPITIDGDHWFATPNDYPYEDTTLHLLVVSRRHVPSFGLLAPEAIAEFGPFVARIEKDYQLHHYALGMRAGDFNFNGSTIEHLHAHIIVASKAPTQKVRFAMSRSPN